MRKLAVVAGVVAMLAPLSARAGTAVHLQAANFRFCAFGAPACTDSPFVTTLTLGQTVDWTYNDKLCDAFFLAGLGCGHDIRIQKTPGSSATEGPGTVQNDGADPTNPARPLLWSKTFTIAGTYQYYCSAHKGEGMLGTIVVA